MEDKDVMTLKVMLQTLRSLISQYSRQKDLQDRQEIRERIQILVTSIDEIFALPKATYLTSFKTIRMHYTELLQILEEQDKVSRRVV